MSLRVYLDRHDIWVGLYWKVEKEDFVPLSTPIRAKEFTVYICPLPFLVFRIRWIRGYKIDADGTWVPIKR